MNFGVTVVNGFCFGVGLVVAIAVMTKLFGMGLH